MLLLVLAFCVVCCFIFVVWYLGGSVLLLVLAFCVVFCFIFVVWYFCGSMLLLALVSVICVVVFCFSVSW